MSIRSINLYATVSAILLLTASCTSGAQTTSEDNMHEDSDSFEGYNRAMFKFNYEVDKYLFKPAAKGYRFVTTTYVRNRMSSALSNIREPIYTINHILQGDLKESGTSLSRLVINSTLGLAGMYDVAGGWGMSRSSTNYDDTMAKWCIKDGPFFILPFIGPATPRSTAGLILDAASNPVYWATYNAPAGTRDKIYYSYSAISIISVREANLDLLDDLEINSVDFYTTMRSAFLQNRKNKGCINNNANQPASYDFDFGYDEEDQIYDEMETK